MKPNLALINFSAVLALGILFLAPAAWAGQIYIDDGTDIFNYGAGNPPGDTSNIINSLQSGTHVEGMAFLYTGSGPELLTAANVSGEVIEYSGNCNKNCTGTNFATVTGAIGLAVDASGDVFVGASDTFGDPGAQIDEFSSAGSPIRTITSGVNQVDALAVDAAGDLYEADNDGKVVEFNSSGGLVGTVATLPEIGGQEPSELYGIALNSAGDIYVSYWNPNEVGGGIDEITPAGNGTWNNPSVFYTAATNLPTGLAYDPQSGNLYMAYLSVDNTPGGGANVFSPVSGTLSSTAATFVTTNLQEPYGIAVETPEPGTFLLSGLGLLAISLFYLHRKNSFAC